MATRTFETRSESKTNEFKTYALSHGWNVRAVFDKRDRMFEIEVNAPKLGAREVSEIRETFGLRYVPEV